MTIVDGYECQYSIFGAWQIHQWYAGKIAKVGLPQAVQHLFNFQYLWTAFCHEWSQNGLQKNSCSGWFGVAHLFSRKWALLMLPERERWEAECSVQCGSGSRVRLALLLCLHCAPCALPLPLLVSGSDASHWKARCETLPCVYCPTAAAKPSTIQCISQATQCLKQEKTQVKTSDKHNLT